MACGSSSKAQRGMQRIGLSSLTFEAGHSAGFPPEDRPHRQLAEMGAAAADFLPSLIALGGVFGPEARLPCFPAVLCPLPQLRRASRQDSQQGRRKPITVTEQRRPCGRLCGKGRSTGKLLCSGERSVYLSCWRDQITLMPVDALQR